MVFPRAIFCTAFVLFIGSAVGATQDLIGRKQQPRLLNGSSQVNEPAQEDPKEVSGRSTSLAKVTPYAREFLLPKNVMNDQKAFWTRAYRLRIEDAPWLVPFLGITSGLISGDREIERSLSKRPRLVKRSTEISNLGTASFGGLAGGFYVWGRLTHNEHMRETGLLSAEAVANSYLISKGLKVISGRERPLNGSKRGDFWRGGESFPSEHAMAAWSLASLVAHEYPGPLTKVLVYGGATAVSAARVASRKHFASDAFVGSALGWYLGRQIYRARHNPELEGAEWGTFDWREGEETRSAQNSASPYVPLDTWIYPAFDRLMALGYANTALVGLRPWTRSECARLLQEAGERMAAESSKRPELVSVYNALREEFVLDTSPEGNTHYAAINQFYTRFAGIAGKPLTDGYHFGQTLINDYGRPYGEGPNLVSGISASAVDGNVLFHLRGEYQHASAVPGYSLPVRQFIAGIDLNPLQAPLSSGVINRFETLDTYAGMTLNNFEVTFGKQSLWWGPSASGPLLFSNNAEPIYMLRISSVTPFRWPGVFHYLGPIRTELFWGKLSGHQFPPRPWIMGQKISFKPSANLELGFSRTVMFGGVGHPLNTRAFYRGFFSNSGGGLDPRKDPGERFVGFDLNYRIPGLRNWLTLYTDSMVSDDPLPLGAPGRAALNPGIFLPRIPGIPKLNLRAEAVYTNDPAGGGRPGQFVYFKFQYHDGYTNKQNLLGNWVGRDGTGFQFWSTYSFTARNTLELSHRHTTVNPKFIPGGGTINDLSSRMNWKLRNDLSLTTDLQYERWRFPVLSPRIERNIEFSVQFNVTPTFLRSR